MKNISLIIVIVFTFISCGNEKLLQTVATDAYTKNDIQKQNIQLSGNHFAIGLDTTYLSILTDENLFRRTSGANFTSSQLHAFSDGFKGGAYDYSVADTVIRNQLFADITVNKLQKDFFEKNYPVSRGDELVIYQKNKDKRLMTDFLDLKTVNIKLCDISFGIKGDINSYIIMYPLEYINFMGLMGSTSHAFGNIQITYCSIWKIEYQKGNDQVILQTGGVDVKYSKDFNPYIGLLRVAQKAADDFMSLLSFIP